MSQSSKLAYALLIGFVVFITVKGQLPAYLATVLGGASAASATASASTGTETPSLFSNITGLFSSDFF